MYRFLFKTPRTVPSIQPYFLNQIWRYYGRCRYSLTEGRCPLQEACSKVYGYMGLVTLQGYEVQLGLLDITILVASLAQIEDRNEQRICYGEVVFFSIPKCHFTHQIISIYLELLVTEDKPHKKIATAMTPGHTMPPVPLPYHDLHAL